MSITIEQLKTLVGLIGTTGPDSIDCDECFGRIGEFAEYSLENRELSEGMKVIEVHLRQCPCCNDEYLALIEALREFQVAEEA